MPNMSYCRFRNTLSDLRDCRDALCDMGDPEVDIKSEEEAGAFKQLIRLCRELADDYGDSDPGHEG